MKKGYKSSQSKPIPLCIQKIRELREGSKEKTTRAQLLFNNGRHSIRQQVVLYFGLFMHSHVYKVLKSVRHTLCVLRAVYIFWWIQIPLNFRGNV